MIDEDENDDIICLDSDYEPSTQPRIKNEPLRAPLAPINPNCDLIANCSPIKKRKLLDKENINPKKSKTIKEILKQEPQPTPVPAPIKQEIQTAKAFLIAQQLQAQAKSERAPPPVVTKYDYKAGVPAQLQASLPQPAQAQKKSEKTESNQASASRPQAQAQAQQEVETNDLEHFENDENVDLVPVESYVSYKPKKLVIGSEHPDVIVETTSLGNIYS